MAVTIICTLLVCFITETSAETCYGRYSSTICIFGCCEDAVYIFCCVSNKWAITIIVFAAFVTIALLCTCFQAVAKAATSKSRTVGVERTAPETTMPRAATSGATSGATSAATSGAMSGATSGATSATTPAAT
ncbi:uncharacterized protein LOC124145993 [Haliotis rufescens]|uniref:uncharacterized protein LOC124145993 n=1 Tax=Haliotis rufescens TaxID=6454 RepID=UPI00201F91F2|nr:uncharacterized protein LOC124145993 [Haliotis rufescens]XP_048243979.1 uncharacterized protein LOC124145993 [Haliotis rufescens]